MKAQAQANSKRTKVFETNARRLIDVRISS